jgi:cytochrome P450
MMTTNDIIEELKLFYFAGMETTAVLLTWTMVVLSMHPEWQDRAREEVHRVFGKNQPESEGINQLRIVSTKILRCDVIFISYLVKKALLYIFCCR